MQQVGKQKKHWKKMLEIIIVFLFVLSFIALTTYINQLTIAFETVLFSKFLLLQDPPEESTLDSNENLALPSLHLSMWNKRLYEKEWASTSQGRRLRGVGADDEEGTFFETWMQQEEQVWDYLGDQLGNALLGEVPLEKCRTGLCEPKNGEPQTSPKKYMLQVHRLLGSAKLELRRIETGFGESGDVVSNDISDLTFACRVPVIYSENSIVRVKGKRSPIIIKKCFPDENALFARWNETPYGYPPFTTAGKGEPFEYFIPLNISEATWKEEILSLRKRGFLDENARALTVYFNAYNANTDLLICTQLSIKFVHTGGIQQRANVRTLSLNRHLNPLFKPSESSGKAGDIALLFIEFLFAILLLAALYLQGVLISDYGLFYFFDIWNCVTLAALGLSCFVEVKRVLLQLELNELLSRDDHPNDYAPLYDVAEDAYELQLILSVNMLMMLASMFKFFHLSPKLGMLTSTVSRASVQLLWFMLLFIVLFMSYVVAFYMAFGSTVDNFATISNSAYALVTVLLGAVDFEDLFEHNAFMGPFLFWSYVILVYIVMMSCFIAIIMEAFGKAKDDAHKQHDPLADLIAAIFYDNTRAAKEWVSTWLRTCWTILTNSRNVQLTSSSRVNLRVIRAQQVLEMVHETAMSAAPMVHLMPNAVASRAFGHAKLRNAAWRELRSREVVTQELLRRVKKVKERQVELLREAALVQEQQLAELEDISTELWNSWQISLELST
mmetsp:Transcript_23749/g.57226  ORF Transcript_23749/g.57226 Transcript_23749/m.57226 type:complete len:727 (+) Transcript_23749:3-2183(+)